MCISLPSAFAPAGLVWLSYCRLAYKSTALSHQEQFIYLFIYLVFLVCFLIRILNSAFKDILFFCLWF